MLVVLWGGSRTLLGMNRFAPAIRSRYTLGKETASCLFPRQQEKAGDRSK